MEWKDNLFPLGGVKSKLLEGDEVYHLTTIGVMMWLWMLGTFRDVPRIHVPAFLFQFELVSWGSTPGCKLISRQAGVVKWSQGVPGGTLPQTCYPYMMFCVRSDLVWWYAAIGVWYWGRVSSGYWLWRLHCRCHKRHCILSENKSGDQESRRQGCWCSTGCLPKYQGPLSTVLACRHLSVAIFLVIFPNWDSSFFYIWRLGECRLGELFIRKAECQEDDFFMQWSPFATL